MNFTNSTQAAVSNEHFGPVVSIITLLLLSISILALGARLSTGWAVSHNFKLADFLLGTALLFYIGNGISTCFEASNGLGSPTTASSTIELLTIQKASYAAELCYIAGLCFSKLSTVAFLHPLTPDSGDRLLCVCYGIFTLLWTAIALITDALQCSTPRVWLVLANRCFNQYAFWTTFLVIEIFLNCLLILLPIYMLWGLRVRQKQKIAIWCCFGARIFVIAAVIVQLVMYTNAYRSSDFFYHSWGWTTASEVVLCLSFVTPCLPYLRPFLESLESGMYANDGISRLDNAAGGIESNAFGSNGSRSSHIMQKLNKNGQRQPFSSKAISNPAGTLGTEVRESDGQWALERDATPSLESQTSGARIIKKTTS